MNPARFPRSNRADSRRYVRRAVRLTRTYDAMSPRDANSAKKPPAENSGIEVAAFLMLAELEVPVMQVLDIVVLVVVEYTWLYRVWLRNLS